MSGINTNLNSIILRNPSAHADGKGNPTPTRTVLELLIEKGFNPEYGCKEGFCGACRCVIKEGNVEHDSNKIAFHKDNEIIPCAARIKSDEIEITYEY